MNTEIIKKQIALTLLKGVGHMTAKLLIANAGGVEAVFDLNKRSLLKIPNIGIHTANSILQSKDLALERAEKELEFLQKNKIVPLFYTDKNYPYRLKECLDAPVILYSKGNVNYNQQKVLGIVGTRKITEYGKQQIVEFVSSLAKQYPDVLIVSGLAYGVDIHAHKLALDSGLSTVGVLGHGLDRIYPSLHTNIAKQMIHQGALLTEYVTQTKPDKQNFVQRNRIIAGVSDAVLVVESAARGGALITVEFANSYNREVFAFPGRIRDPYSAGCNKIIKENKAVLIESSEDLAEFMSWDINKNNQATLSLFVELTEIEKKVLSVFTMSEAKHINTLTKELNFSIDKLIPLLIEMEFKGLLKCLPGNMYMTC